MPTSQQNWNKRNPEKMREYDAKRRSQYRDIKVRLHKERDRELIQFLESLGHSSLAKSLKITAEEKMCKSKKN